jgi:hypothetical protein
MSSLPESPDLQREHRLVEIRREVEKKGQVEAIGVRPAGAPFPQATPEAGYYGIPLLKEPQWKPEVPVYFFVGGASGAAAVIGAIADWTGKNPDIARDARWVAAVGAAVSTGLLIADLGRPSRFLNMLRVFKPQSPMSVGAWTLAAFGSASGAAAFAQLFRDRLGDFAPIRWLGNISQAASALFGLPFSNYTGVLIGATAIPVWNTHIDTLPIHFGMSGLGSAVSTLELMGHTDSPALNLLGFGAAAIESWEGFNIEIKKKAEEASDPLRRGFSGWTTRVGGVLSGPVPLALRAAAALTGSRSRDLRRWAAISSLAGSLITRFAWVRAGRASAQDYRLPLRIPAEPTQLQPVDEQLEELAG